MLNIRWLRWLSSFKHISVTLSSPSWPQRFLLVVSVTNRNLLVRCGNWKSQRISRRGILLTAGSDYDFCIKELWKKKLAEAFGQGSYRLTQRCHSFFFFFFFSGLAVRKSHWTPALYPEVLPLPSLSLKQHIHLPWDWRRESGGLIPVLLWHFIFSCDLSGGLKEVLNWGLSSVFLLS